MTRANIFYCSTAASGSLVNKLKINTVPSQPRQLKKHSFEKSRFKDVTVPYQYIWFIPSKSYQGKLFNLKQVQISGSFASCVVSRLLCVQSEITSPKIDEKCSLSQLVCLVIMDSVLLVFSVIDSAYLTAFENPEPAWYKALFPYFWHPFKNVATTCCAYMVVAIAAER